MKIKNTNPIEDRYLSSSLSVFRLFQEYKHYGKLYVAIDFDHTLYDYDQIGDTFPKLKEIIRKAQEKGCIMILFTAREGEKLEFAVNHCKSFGFIPDYINESPVMQTRKPFYSILLDDRAGLNEAYQTLSLVLNLI